MRLRCQGSREGEALCKVQQNIQCGDDEPIQRQYLYKSHQSGTRNSGLQPMVTLPNRLNVFITSRHAAMSPANNPRCGTFDSCTGVSP